jgi:hypothetical protein
MLSEIPVVVAVVDAGSFVGAGKALGLSQSGVSRAIQRLEKRLGARGPDCECLEHHGIFDSPFGPEIADLSKKGVRL